MASRYGLEQDDRELAPAPEFIPCDVCGLLVAITDEDEEDDEEVLCLVCANSRSRQARRALTMTNRPTLVRRLLAQLDEIEPQLDSTVPYYLPALIRDVRAALTHDPRRCMDCGTLDFSTGRGCYEDGDVCGRCAMVRAHNYQEQERA